MLAVVVHHGEVQRLDPAEIGGIEHVLGADPGRAFGTEIAMEERQHRAEHGKTRHVQLAAARLEMLAQRVIDERIENDPRVGLDLLQRMIELLLVPEQRKNVLDRGHGRELRSRRAADRKQGLAGRVRDEMQMKIAFGVRRLRRHALSRGIVNKKVRIHSITAPVPMPGEKRPSRPQRPLMEKLGRNPGENREVLNKARFFIFLAAIEAGNGVG